MHENEPRLPSNEELRKIHEEAPPPEPPNHKPNRLNYEELKSRPPATERETEQVNLTDVIESEVAAYQKDLDARVEAGRITPHERTYLMTRYDQLQACILKSPEADASRVGPEPTKESTEQKEGQERASVKRPDWKLMMIDSTYQKNVTKDLDARKAAYIHKMETEQANEP